MYGQSKICNGGGDGERLMCPRYQGRWKLNNGARDEGADSSGIAGENLRDLRSVAYRSWGYAQADLNLGDRLAGAVDHLTSEGECVTGRRYRRGLAGQVYPDLINVRACANGGLRRRVSPADKGKRCQNRRTRTGKSPHRASDSGADLIS